MANLKITELTSVTTPTNDDLVVIVDDPTGTPGNSAVTLANLGKGLHTIWATTLTATNITADNIVGTTTSGTSIIATNLTGTNIHGTTLTATNVTASNIVGTAVTGTNIIATNLTGTNIHGTTLTATDISATTIDSGNLTSLVSVIITGGDLTLLTTQVKGHLLLTTAEVTATLPAVVEGSLVTIYSMAAAAVMVDPNDNDRIILDGTAGADGKKITSASGSGDFATLIGDSADGWIVIGRSGTWTLEG